jgi:hypothetical protein
VLALPVAMTSAKPQRFPTAAGTTTRNAMGGKGWNFDSNPTGCVVARL